MTQQTLPPARVPAIVRLGDPLVRRLLTIGFPMGPNTLLTVAGRKSGLPRSAGVALVQVEERAWVMGAYGSAQWVRNLAHAGEGTIRLKGVEQRVRARLLTVEEAAVFFRTCWRRMCAGCRGSGDWRVPSSRARCCATRIRPRASTRCSSSS